LGLDGQNFLLLAVLSQLELSWPTSFLPAVTLFVAYLAAYFLG